MTVFIITSQGSLLNTLHFNFYKEYGGLSGRINCVLELGNAQSGTHRSPGNPFTGHTQVEIASQSFNSHHTPLQGEHLHPTFGVVMKKSSAQVFIELYVQCNTKHLYIDNRKNRTYSTPWAHAHPRCCHWEGFVSDSQSQHGSRVVVFGPNLWMGERYLWEGHIDCDGKKEN